MAYTKVFLKGGASIKQFDWGNVMKVSINIEDLLAKAKSGEIEVSEMGNLYFDIVEKKKEKQKPNENTHYLVHSRKDGEDTHTPKADDDLPF